MLVTTFSELDRKTARFEKCYVFFFNVHMNWTEFELGTLGISFKILISFTNSAIRRGHQIFLNFQKYFEDTKFVTDLKLFFFHLLESIVTLSFILSMWHIVKLDHFALKKSLKQPSLHVLLSTPVFWEFGSLLLSQFEFGMKKNVERLKGNWMNI